MKLSIDDDRCAGHARCFTVAPEHFDLDDEGHAVVIRPDVPAGHEADAWEAARSCPETAVIIED